MASYDKFFFPSLAGFAADDVAVTLSGIWSGIMKILQPTLPIFWLSGYSLPPRCWHLKLNINILEAWFDSPESNLDKHSKKAMICQPNNRMKVVTLYDLIAVKTASHKNLSSTMNKQRTWCCFPVFNSVLRKQESVCDETRIKRNQNIRGTTISSRKTAIFRLESHENISNNKWTAILWVRSKHKIEANSRLWLKLHTFPAIYCGEAAGRALALPHLPSRIANNRAWSVAKKHSVLRGILEYQKLYVNTSALLLHSF